MAGLWQLILEPGEVGGVASRPGLYFDLLGHTVRGPDVVAFLAEVHRRLAPLGDGGVDRGEMPPEPAEWLHAPNRASRPHTRRLIGNVIRPGRSMNRRLQQWKPALSLGSERVQKAAARSLEVLIVSPIFTSSCIDGFAEYVGTHQSTSQARYSLRTIRTALASLFGRANRYRPG